MNRRDFLKRAFAATAAGVLVPTQVIPALADAPERRFWSLDRTMLRPERTVLATPWFDASMAPFTTTWTVGDYTLKAHDPWVIANYIKVPPGSPLLDVAEAQRLAIRMNDDSWRYTLDLPGDTKFVVDRHTIWKVIDEHPIVVPGMDGGIVFTGGGGAA